MRLVCRTLFLTEFVWIAPHSARTATTIPTITKFVVMLAASN